MACAYGFTESAPVAADPVNEVVFNGVNHEFKGSASIDVAIPASASQLSVSAPKSVRASVRRTGIRTAHIELMFDAADLVAEDVGKPIIANIVTGAATKPIVPVRIVWNVISPYYTIETELSSLSMRSGSSVSILVARTDDKPFRIQNVDIPISSITVGTDFTKTTKFHRIDINLVQMEVATKATITIVTDDPLVPFLSIPLNISNR
jgi:hypothetical protein